MNFMDDRQFRLIVLKLLLRIFVRVATGGIGGSAGMTEKERMLYKEVHDSTDHLNLW